MNNVKPHGVPKYYIIYWDETNTITGPMSFKKACEIHKRSLIPCEILKKVIDVHGKEVK